MMKLPAARAGQIRSLATARKLGLTETVEYLLNLAIEAGEIADVLPGYEVVRDGDFVRLTIDGQILPKMNRTMALAVADDLQHAATALRVGRGTPRFYGRDGLGGADFVLVIGRHGAGVLLGLEEVIEGQTLGTGKQIKGAITHGMASDLARQVRNAANTH
jgi:hypothetical protein